MAINSAVYPDPNQTGEGHLDSSMSSSQLLGCFLHAHTWDVSRPTVWMAHQPDLHIFSCICVCVCFCYLLHHLLTYLFIHLLTYLPTHCFTCMHDWSSHSVASLLSHLLRHSLAFSFLQLLTHIHHYHLPTCLTTKFSDSARCCWLFSVLGLLEWLVHHSLIPDLLTLVARSPSGLLTQLMQDMPPLLLHSLSSLTHSLM